MFFFCDSFVRFVAVFALHLNGMISIDETEAEAAAEEAAEAAAAVHFLSYLRKRLAQICDFWHPSMPIDDIRIKCVCGEYNKKAENK